MYHAYKKIINEVNNSIPGYVLNASRYIVEILIEIQDIVNKIHQ